MQELTATNEMTESMENQTKHLENKRLAQRFLYFIPLFLLVPMAFWQLFEWLGYAMNWAAFGIGAAGWYVALMLRIPLQLLVRNLPQERAVRIVGWFSGPAEESLRVLALAVFGAAFPYALSLGQGWAAIEVAFTILNGAILGKVLSRQDEKSIQVRAILEQQGTYGKSPLWGIVERIFASCLHIGFTLICAYNLWLALVLIPLHSATNMVIVATVRRNMLLGQALLAVVGGGSLVVGFLLFA